MEHLVNFIVWALTVIGITVIVTQSNIFLPLRKRITGINNYLGTLVNCSFCFCFWAAMGVSLLTKGMTGNLILDGCLGCGMWYYTTYGSNQAMPHHH
jgi:hypothetical protein